MEANSTPITPPPMMLKLLGTSFNWKSSSLVNTPSLSSPGIGTKAGLEPTAKITCFA